MLTTCPECNLQISDKAITCPHCGYPLKPQPATRRPRKPRREHRRLPNGFGRITKINRNLTNPYRVMVTVGHDKNGKPIGRLLKPKAYFPTYNDAYIALVEYNRKPYELDKSTTVKELFEMWYKSVENSVVLGTLNGYKMAWHYCSKIYDVEVREIRIHHIRYCIEYGTYEKNGIVRSSSSPVKVRIKQLLSMMFDYAVEYELVDKNPARAITMPKNITKDLDQEAKHICFTDAEMDLLWSNLGTVPYIDVVLFQCYSGWRPQELGEIKLDDVDLKNWIITGGMKTKAGRGRIVPIHTCVRGIVVNMYNLAVTNGNPYLVTTTDARNMHLSYDKYYQRFMEIVRTLKLNPDHKPHDPRKQFVTMANDANMNEYAIKRIVGHTIKDITEKIYTERNPNWLADEMEKIKGPVLTA